MYPFSYFVFPAGEIGGAESSKSETELFTECYNKYKGASAKGKEKNYEIPRFYYKVCI